MSLLFSTYIFWNVFNLNVLISREKNLKIVKNVEKRVNKKRYGSTQKFRNKQYNFGGSYQQQTQILSQI